VFLGLLILVVGSALALLSVRYLAAFLERCSPRVWRGAALPPQSSEEIHALAVFAVCITAFFSLFLISLFSMNIFVDLLLKAVLLILSTWSGWAFVMRQRWWKLESGSPLRFQIDAIAQSNCFSLGKVRLRDGDARIPRIYIDGSIEPTIGFFEKVSLEEQQFILNAVLFERENKKPLNSFWQWIGVSGCFFLSTFCFLGLSIEVISGISLMAGCFFGVIFLLGVILKLVSPRLSDEALRFALEQTGDIKMAEKAIRGLDPRWVNARLIVLQRWWDDQPKNRASVPTASVVSSAPTQAQVLGRRP
jgi:hypothetical protein